DPACMSGFECVQAPQGWTAVAFSEQSRPICPTGYSSPTPVVEISGSSPASCTCGYPNLTVSPSCTDGNSHVTGGATLACGGYRANITFSNALCPTPTSFPALANIAFAPIPPTAGSCTAPLIAVTKPPVQAFGGQTCELFGGAAGGCPAGSLCTPKLTSPF